MIAGVATILSNGALRRLVERVRQRPFTLAFAGG
jgi:hypothetical protein